MKSQEEVKKIYFTFYKKIKKFTNIYQSIFQHNMTNKTKAIALWSFLFVFGISCQNNSENKATSDENVTNEKDSVAMTNLPDTIETVQSKLLTFPKKIQGESDRYVDKNGILHIDLSGANFPASKKDELITLFFPKCTKDSLIVSDAYFACNILCSKDKYNIVIIHESAEEGEILSYAFISEGKFDLHVLELLFS
ncbi:MAG: hypothetical protein CSB01_00585 [Bacteroidia bacterium]|nr:MAG: hypothetical protein CSB01_00585 [Bacteroidia bacterium]